MTYWMSDAVAGVSLGIATGLFVAMRNRGDDPKTWRIEPVMLNRELAVSFQRDF